MAKSKKVESQGEGQTQVQGCVEEGREAQGKEAGRQRPRPRWRTACRSHRPSRSARPARRSTACASSTSRMCSRGRPARSCSRYMGADCIKVERPGVGDITRGQLRDVKGPDSLYFTMLNGNKRSITIDSKHPKGKEILERLIKHCDVLVENFRARRARPHGADLGAHPQDQPAHDRGVGEGLRPRPLRGLQGLRERRAMRGRRGLHHRLPRGPAARSPARRSATAGTGLHLAFGIVSALYQRIRTGRGQQRAVRDAGRRAQPRAREAARSAAPRARAAHGIQPIRRGRPVREGGAARRQRLRRRTAGLDPQRKGWETDPDAYIYFITQAPVWGRSAI